LVVLTGENGAGKTNVLEAVSLLSPGRGLRGASLGEMARSGGPGGFGISARKDLLDIGTGTIASAPERRQVLAEDAPDREWLSALEARMAEHGTALSEARAATIAALAERLADAPDGPFARPSLAMEGGREDLRHLASSRARDAAAGRTLIGPHRTDLLVTHVAKNQPASLCSTGEQKALLLAIVLAHADLVAERSGRRPILLLDEVAAHLDPSRRAALFERLGAAGGQVWMTGTEPALFEAVDGAATWYEVTGGRLQSR
jgi:DNA replication and repair protein RecF